MVTRSKDNPCGICRAYGLPICKGHGGGGADEATEKDSDSSATSSLNHQPNPVSATNLSTFLNNSNAWQQTNNHDLYQYHNPLATLIPSLNPSTGVIKFKAKNMDQDEIDSLYEAIKAALAEFKHELNTNDITFDARLTKQANSLTLTISDPNQYDAFILRLMEKNLIPNERLQTILQSSATNMGSDHQSPTPFNISSGPTPPGKE